MTNEKENAKSPIAYQNKDITSKVLAGLFKGKTFRVYGLDLPRIIKAEPTNIPAITASELRLDNLFQLADRTVAIVDYESKVIDARTSDRIRRMIHMNKIEGLFWKEAYEKFEKEKQEALEQAAAEYEKEKKQAAKRYRQEKRKQKETLKKYKNEKKILEAERQKHEAERQKHEAEKQKHEAEKRQIAERLMEHGESTEFILSIIPEWTYEEVERMRQMWEKEKLEQKNSE